MGIAADFVLIVVAGLLGGILARILKLPLLVGYVFAGVAIGPYTAGPTVSGIHDIELLAEIGVALLLFSLGLEISLRDMQLVRRIALIGGPIQIVVTTLLGYAGGVELLGMRSTEAAWFGAMVSVSSTMVVLKILAADGVTTTLASRVMIGMLVMQDLAVIPMLVILPALSSPEGLLRNVLAAIAAAAGVLSVVVWSGTRIFPKLLRKVLEWGSRELFLVAVVAIGVGVGYAMHTVGLSFSLGAFVAGLILSESEFSHQALSDVVPLRDIFGLLFFVSVGMLFDPHFAIANAGTIAAVIAAIFILKALVIGVITRSFSYKNMAPWIVGLGLSQIGEFSFVLARTGFSGGHISKPVYDLSLTCTVLTMALAPLVSRTALPLGRWWRGLTKQSPPPQAELASGVVQLSGHVIVAGYGRTGRAAAEALQIANVPMVIVESSLECAQDIGRQGTPAIWGDIAGAEILHAAHVESARVLLLTVPDRNTVHLATVRARQVNPQVIVIARALREHHVDELLKIGVAAAIQPEFEGGVTMVRQALLRVGRGSEEVDQITTRIRDNLYRHGDPAL